MFGFKPTHRPRERGLRSLYVRFEQAIIAVAGNTLTNNKSNGIPVRNGAAHMNKELKTSGMNRRQFLQTGAASAMFLGLGGVQLFAAPSAGARRIRSHG